jgi:hypothetical protein
VGVQVNKYVVVDGDFTWGQHQFRQNGVLGEEQCEARVIVRVVATPEAGLKARFHGSPTIRIDGVDIEVPSVEHQGYQLRCRTYHPNAGQLGVPHPDTIRQALYTHPGKRHPWRLERT